MPWVEPILQYCCSNEGNCCNCSASNDISRATRFGFKACLNQLGSDWGRIHWREKSLMTSLTNVYLLCNMDGISTWHNKIMNWQICNVANSIVIFGWICFLYDILTVKPYTDSFPSHIVNRMLKVYLKSG